MIAVLNIEERQLMKTCFLGLFTPNHLVGVLNRFSLGLAAPTVKVKAPEKQRWFLRFLWWNESIFDSEIIGHKMCVNLFGAVP